MDRIINNFLPASPEVFTYDLDGNLTGDGRFTYAWDAENRLTTMETLATVPFAAKRKLAFAYDGMGRRIRKTTWFPKTGGGWQLHTEVKFLHELGGWNVQAETNSAGEILQTYVWGSDLSGSLSGAGGVGGLLFTTSNPDNSTHAYGSDLNGNVSLLVNTTSGQASASYEYGPFGEPLRESGFYAKLNPFRFSSKYTDDETGLVDYGLRYYRAVDGRWLSRDPIEEQGGVNLYGFVGNDGVNEWDYLGLLVSITYVKDANDNGKGCVTVTDQDIGTTHKYFAFSTPALPDGIYEVLERAGKKSYYRLEANDAAFGDDKAEMAGQVRTNLRFHKVSGSAGCIACQKDDHANWDKAEEIILKTKTSTKEVIMKGFLGSFGIKETLRHYGKLTVSTAKNTNE